MDVKATGNGNEEEKEYIFSIRLKGKKHDIQIDGDWDEKARTMLLEVAHQIVRGLEKANQAEREQIPGNQAIRDDIGTMIREQNRARENRLYGTPTTAPATFPGFEPLPPDVGPYPPNDPVAGPFYDGTTTAGPP